MNLKKQYYIYIFILFSIFVIDRVSKIYVIYLDNKNLQSEIFLSKFLNIYLVWNEGIAFGLFSFNEQFYYIDKDIKTTSYRKNFWLSRLRDRLNFVERNINNDEKEKEVIDALNLLQNEVRKENNRTRGGRNRLCETIFGRSCVNFRQFERGS